MKSEDKLIKLQEELKALEIHNKNDIGSIAPTFASAILTADNKVEIVIYELETYKPLFKFQLEALGCDSKLMSLLDVTYKKYLEQQKTLNRETVFDAIRKEKNELPVVYIGKSGSC